MRVCFFVLGTCYIVLSYYSSHLAQTVILFFFKCLCVCVCVCVCLCVRDSTCVCTHRYACVKQDIGFSKRRNGFLWTEHYLNSNTVKCYKKPYSTVKPMRIQRRIVARFGLTTSIFSDDLDCCRIHTSKNTCTHIRANLHVWLCTTAQIYQHHAQMHRHTHFLYYDLMPTHSYACVEMINCHCPAE